MIKKLDKLVIQAFIGPFIATFFITLFVLVMQFFWLYIDDIVGKGLDFVTIGRFIAYVSATLVPLALPLAVLLSSIMTFGNLGETFELVAIKSAGIPLLRFMQPLFIVSLMICGVAFLFNNNIGPVATLKMRTLQYDIIVAKPALDIKEGVFYDRIPDYVIKIGKKDKDGSTIRNVIIYEQNVGLQDNVIVANKGTMIVTPDKKFLEFDLQDGWLYQEKGDRISTNTDFIRLGFKDYKKILDLSTFKLTKSNEDQFKGNYQMLNMKQLGATIDSLKKALKNYPKKVNEDLKPYLGFVKNLDSNWAKAKPVTLKKNQSFIDLLPDSARRQVLQGSISVANNSKAIIETSAMLYDNDYNNLRLHQIAWHSKITMSVACLVLFLIGAPLGSIIRKGGIGLPLIFSVIFFVIFYLLNNYGTKFVKEEVMNPTGGMWMATFVLTPIGLFLTYKALNDSQLFNKEFYYRTFKKLGLTKKKPEKPNPEDLQDNPAS
ncbi:MAG: LptF/LptG family permease [Bacteroidetes bacterium]|nr:LptF/LptG family permease [Bacteroidota bacterium]